MRFQRFSLRLLAYLGALVLLLQLVPAHAGQKEVQEIRQQMEEGLNLFVGGKADEAAQRFDAGYAKYKYSAFLFNAGVCYEKLAQPAEALSRFQQYVQVDPDAPDIPDVRERIARLEAQISGAAPAPAVGVDEQSIRSLVQVETDPVGAPVVVYRPKTSSAPPFQTGGSNEGWERIQQVASPANLSLGVGKYQIVIEKMRDFKELAFEVDVEAGHVYHYTAQLRQGTLLTFLRVTSNVRGAHIWLDKAIGDGPEWGTTPYGELVESGERVVNVEAPGFVSASRTIKLDPGDPEELNIELQRVDYGFLRIDGSDSPEVQISLDDEPQGRWLKGAPGLKVKASAGRHRLTVEADGRKTFEGTVEVPRGQVLPISVRMIPKYPRGAAWGQAAISAALFGGGIYLGLESERLKDELQSDAARGTLDGEDMRISKGRWFAAGADAAFVGGTILAALSTWNFIRDPLPESSMTVLEAVEFEDPRAKRPTAKLAPRSPRHEIRAASSTASETKPVTRRSSFSWSPTASEDFAGFVIGGSF